MADGGKRMLQGKGQLVRARPVPLQELVGHPLRRLRTHAGQDAQSFDQPLKPSRGGDGLLGHSSDSEGQLHAGRQPHAGRNAAHFLRDLRLDPPCGIVERRGHQVLEHFLVVAHQ